MITKPNYKAILIIFAILLCLLTYSFITETIMHVFKEGNTLLGILGSTGFIIIITGVSVFAFGGYVFYENTNRLYTYNEKLNQNTANLRNPDASKEIKSKSRKENFHFLIMAWKPSFKFLVLGILLIFIGAIMTNIAEGTIHI